VTMMNGLLWSLHDSDVDELMKSNARDEHLSPIMNEFLGGCSYQIYGCKLHRAFVGRRLRDVVAAVLIKNDLLIIGAQVEGKILLNPDVMVEKNVIVFVLAPERSALKVIETTAGAAWDQDFIDNRRAAQGKLLNFSRDIVHEHDREVLEKRVLNTVTGKIDVEYVEVKAPEKNLELAKSSTATFERPSWARSASGSSSGASSSGSSYTDEESSVGADGRKKAASLSSASTADTSADDVPEYLELSRLHVFFVVAGDQGWHDVCFILERVKRDAIGRILVLTLICERVPPDVEQILMNMGVELFVGFLSDGPKLMQAGMLEADVIVVSNGSTNDSEVLARLCTIRKLQVHAKHDYAQVIGELKNGLKSLDVYTYVERYHYLTRATERRLLDIPVDKYFVKAPDGDKDKAGRSYMLGAELCGHDNYLQGGVILSDLYGYVLARMVYLPGVIEILALLLQPKKDSGSFMAQVKIPPKFIGRTFKELQRAWVTSDECILPLGLYRSREIPLPDGDSKVMRYFVTMAPADIVLQDSDYATVIAPQSWVEMMGRKRLLRCGKDQALDSFLFLRQGNRIRVKSKILETS